MTRLHNVGLNEQFLRAVLPDTTVVFGQRLLPYSLGHHLLLQRIESPFIDGGLITYRDTLETVLVLSRRFDQAAELIQSPAARWMATAWHLRLSWLRMRTVDYKAAAELVHQHISKCAARPVVMPSGASREINMPHGLLMMVALMREFNMDRDAVLNQPLGLTEWLYAGLAEFNGAGSMETPDEFMDAVRRSEEIRRKFESGEWKFPQG